MLRGLYTSALSMTTQMKRMDVISNNIANVDTTGFKKDTAVTQSFSEELMKRVNDPEYDFFNVPKNIGGASLGVFVQSVHTNFDVGSLKKTEGNFDLAISGTGFFKVSVNGDAEVKYTRDGSFTLSPDGVLVTKDGHKVMGENGEIKIPNGEIMIDSKGNVYSNNQIIDKLSLVDFENLDSLRKIGGNLYKTTDDSNEKPFSANVVQGYLEASNVISVSEMVDMIAVNRLYEANQRVITTIDSTLQKAVNEIGRK